MKFGEISLQTRSTKFGEVPLQTKSAAHDDGDVTTMVKSLAQNVTKVLGEAKEAHTKHDETLAEHNARIADIEQKQVSHPGGAGAATQSKGIEHIVQSPAFAMLKSGQTPRARIALDQGFMAKAALLSTNPQGQAVVAPDRRADIVAAPLRRLTIRDLLRNELTTSNLIEFTRETLFVNNAGAQFVDGQTEGALKNESVLSFEMVQAPVVTLAHWLPASKQILDDAPQLRNFIANRLLQGLKVREENQLLNGPGTNGTIGGLLKPGNYTAFNNELRGADDTKLDTLRRAILQLQLAERDPTGVVLNPVDWADMELQKDAGGSYIWVDVATGGGTQVWRLAVVPTTAIAAGTFLVGDFPAAAVVYDRQDAIVEISREDRDNFVKNMVTILVENRLALAIEAPGALVYGPFVVP